MKPLRQLRSTTPQGAFPPAPSEGAMLRHGRRLSHARDLSNGSEIRGISQAPRGPMTPMNQPHSRQTSGSYNQVYYQQPPPVMPPPFQHSPMIPYAHPLGMPPSTPYSNLYPYAPPGPPAPPYYQQHLAPEPLAKAKTREFLASMQEQSGTGYDGEEVKTLTLYRTENEFFLRTEGALQLLFLLLGISFDVVTVQNDDRQLLRQLESCTYGVLTETFPVCVYEGRAFVQWASTARYLARACYQYGVDASGDYFADAILANLESWRCDQLATVSAATNWIIAGCNSPLTADVQGYLADRPIYYRLLLKMFKKYAHLYRSELLWTSWIDPLILSSLVDDMILDIFFEPVHKFQTVAELTAGQFANLGCFFNTMLDSFPHTIAVMVNAKLAAARKRVKSVNSTLGPSASTEAE